MRAARLIFGLAGLYGLIVLAPFLFLERAIADATPGALTHVEYYYGFLGAGLAMQLVYLTIARDPIRYRPLMLVGTIAKLAFFVPVLLLWMQGRVPGAVLAFASVDGLLALAFLQAWRVTPTTE